MKESLRKLFSPILTPLEKGEVGSNYRASHRTILKVVAALFLVLSLGSVLALVYTGELGALIPAIFFFAIGSLSLVVATLGSDVAVSKMWGNR